MAITLDGTNGINNGDADITNVGDIAVDSISGDADSNTKITFEGSDVISIDTGGSERMRIDSSGNVGIGNTDPSAGMLVLTKSSDGGFGGSLVLENSNGSDTDKVIIAMRPNGSSTTAVGSYGENRIISEFDSGSTNGASNIQFWTHAGVGTVTERMRIKSNGYLNCLGVYTQTSGDSANVVVDSSGDVKRATSALKYKQEVRDIESIDISSFRPVRYKSNIESDDQTIDHFGFIADEFHDAGLTELVTYGAVDEETGVAEVEGFRYDRMTAVLTKALQDALVRIDTLETTVADLQTRVTALEAN